MKLAPFSKKERVQSEVYLFIGRKSWQKATDFQLQRPGTLCLPPFLSAYDYEWPVNNADVLMFDTGSGGDDDYIEEIVKCLFAYGANKVSFVDQDDQFFVFKKGITT